MDFPPLYWFEDYKACEWGRHFFYITVGIGMSWVIYLAYIAGDCFSSVLCSSMESNFCWELTKVGEPFHFGWDRE